MRHLTVLGEPFEYPHSGYRGTRRFPYVDIDDLVARLPEGEVRVLFGRLAEMDVHRDEVQVDDLRQMHNSLTRLLPDVSLDMVEIVSGEPFEPTVEGSELLGFDLSDMELSMIPAMFGVSVTVDTRTCASVPAAPDESALAASGYFCLAARYFLPALNEHRLFPSADIAEECLFHFSLIYTLSEKPWVFEVGSRAYEVTAVYLIPPSA